MTRPSAYRQPCYFYLEHYYGLKRSSLEIMDEEEDNRKYVVDFSDEQDNRYIVTFDIVLGRVEMVELTPSSVQ